MSHACTKYYPTKCLRIKVKVKVILVASKVQILQNPLTPILPEEQETGLIDV